MKVLPSSSSRCCRRCAEAQNWPSFRGRQASGVAEGRATPTTWDATKGAGSLEDADPGPRGLEPDRLGRHDLRHHRRQQRPEGGLPPRPLRRRRALEGRHAALLARAAPSTRRPARSSGSASRTRACRRPSGIRSRARPRARRSRTGRSWSRASARKASTPTTSQGKLLWKQDLGRIDAGWFFDPDYEWGAASSPVIYKDLVIVQVDRQKDSFVAAFRLKDGEPGLAHRARRDPVLGHADGLPGPAARRARHARHEVHPRLRPGTGKELWRLGPNSEVTTPTPIVAHGLVYVTNGYRGIQPIYAIRPGGSGDLTLQGEATSSAFIAWSTKRGGPYMPTPVVVRRPPLRRRNNGVLAAYDARTGERVYQERVAGKGGAFSASPVAADGKLYLAGEDGEVFVVKAGRKPECSPRTRWARS